MTVVVLMTLINRSMLTSKRALSVHPSSTVNFHINSASRQSWHSHLAIFRMIFVRLFGSAFYCFSKFAITFGFCFNDFKPLFLVSSSVSTTLPLVCYFFSVKLQTPFQRHSLAMLLTKTLASLGTMVVEKCGISLALFL